jgi:26S proteasome regulatory subunit T2
MEEEFIKNQERLKP